jgi:hypothetical protein
MTPLEHYLALSAQVDDLERQLACALDARDDAWRRLTPHEQDTLFAPYAKEAARG